MTIEEIKESPSYRALMDFWEQRDEDGIIIGVSRQALVETLQLFEEAFQTSQEREREIRNEVTEEIRTKVKNLSMLISADANWGKRQILDWCFPITNPNKD